ncbi:MAG: hypothetical protein ACK4S4_13540 [Pyrinomonadaceae bacterium]
MLEQTTDAPPKRSVLKKAIEIAGDTGRAAVKAEMLKQRAAETVEDVVLDAKRIAKRGRYAAEDLVDDTAYRIKKEPLRAVAVTFAAGLGVGMIAGWSLARAVCRPVAEKEDTL